MVDDIIEITTRRIKNELPIRRIYEYEDTEVLIINSKPKEEWKK